MMIKKVLVTGATGFIGKYFVKYLLQNNVDVCVLVRDKATISCLHANVEIRVGDLTKPNSLLNCCRDIDAVFHLAGYAHAWGDETTEAEKHHQVNYLGTKNIFTEAIRSHVKSFVYFSSVKAVADTNECINEKWDQPAHSAYGIAKRQAEKFLLDAGQKACMHVCVLRPALVYGPDWKGNLASMLRAIDKGFFLPIPETNNQRSLVSINDISQAAWLAATNTNANGKVYFVTDGRYYSTHQLYSLMREALGRSVPKWHMPLFVFQLLAFIGDQAGKLTNRRMPFNSDAMIKLFGSAQYNSEQIQRDIGFKPKDDFRKLLPEIVAAYQAVPK